MSHNYTAGKPPYTSDSTPKCAEKVGSWLFLNQLIVNWTGMYLPI